MSNVSTFFADLFKALRSDPSLEYSLHRLEDATDATPAIQADTQYLRIWLRSARITDVRRWTSKFHASVHARFVLSEPVSGRREVVAVVAPDRTFSEMDPSHLDRLITVNQALLGPVPYRGELDADIGLFSIVASDLAKPYLDLLSGLTNTAGVSFLAKSMPWADTIRRGAEVLFSESRRSQLEIGLARTDTRLTPGHWVVARVPKGKLPEGLRLDSEDYGLLGADGVPISGFPYMVIGVEALDQRDDYAAIPELGASWALVRTAVTEGRPDEEVLKLYEQLRRNIAMSLDLVPTDKRRIVQIFANELSEAGFQLGGMSAVAQHSLESVKRAQSPLRRLRGLEALLTASQLRDVKEELSTTSVHIECDAVNEVSDSLRPRAVLHSDRLGSALKTSAQAWRLAATLAALRETINTLAPLRSKASDGSIGDAAHASRVSDHNPWVEADGKGVVTAIDITHDPDGGCDGERLAESLRVGRDKRVKYVIWNRRIFSSTVEPWGWRPYSGTNSHQHHVHISVQPDSERFDDTAPWKIEV